MSQFPVCRVPLAAVGTAPACARLLVRHVLPCWGLGGLVDDAALVATELVAGAVRASGVAVRTSARTGLGDVEVLGVQLRRCRDSLFIEVWDEDRPWSAEQIASDADDYGRGLLLVSALSDRCGSRTFSDGGRVAWASFRSEGMGSVGGAAKLLGSYAQGDEGSGDSQWRRANVAFDRLLG